MNADKRKNPLFTVIVPTYNNEEQLEKCVRSILAQSYTDFELILVDDGSTDATPIICDCFAKQDSRISVIHKAKEGVAKARNTGLFQASGKYIYYADADDWIAEQLLQEAAKILRRSGAPDMFVFGHEMILEDGQTVSYPCFVKPGLYQKKRLEKEIYPKMMYPRGRRTWMPVVSSYMWDKIFRRELLMEHYCKDISLFLGEDSVCAYECVYFAEQIYFSPSVLYFYDRSSSSSVHARYHEDLLENYERRVQYLRKHLGGRGDRAIERQINKVEYDGLYDVLWQELQFTPSVRQVSIRMGEKVRQIKRFPICPMKGLSFRQKCFVFLLSIRLQFVLALGMKGLILGSHLRKRLRQVPAHLSSKKLRFLFK